MYVTALIDVGTQLTEAVRVDTIVRSEGKEYVYWLADEHVGAESNHMEAKSDSGRVYSFTKAEVVSGIRELGYAELLWLKKSQRTQELLRMGILHFIETNGYGA